MNEIKPTQLALLGVGESEASPKKRKPKIADLLARAENVNRMHRSNRLQYERCLPLLPEWERALKTVRKGERYVKVFGEHTNVESLRLVVRFMHNYAYAQFSLEEEARELSKAIKAQKAKFIFSEIRALD